MGKIEVSVKGGGGWRRLKCQWKGWGMGKIEVSVEGGGGGGDRSVSGGDG